MTLFLFVHGAWHGGWCWSKVAGHLTEERHIALTPDLPGRNGCQLPHKQITLRTHVDFLKMIAESRSEEIVVVAHSFGGIIATQLANEIPSKISRIIYVCAFLPENEQSLMGIARSTNHEKQPKSMQIDPEGHTISLDLADLPHLFFNRCSFDIQQDAINRLCPEPFYPMMEKVQLNSREFSKIPKTYVECTKDNALTLEAQRKMHEKYTCDVNVLPADHSPFLSMPDELAYLLKRP